MMTLLSSKDYHEGVIYDIYTIKVVYLCFSNTSPCVLWWRGIVHLSDFSVGIDVKFFEKSLVSEFH